MTQAIPWNTPVTVMGKLDSGSDEELIAAMNHGDADAFEVLYYRHRDWVVNLAYRFTQDRDLALDVLQETFLYFLKKFPGFCLTANLRSFFYPAVRHLSISARRKSERYQTHETDLGKLETLMATEPTVAEGEPLAEVLSGLTEEHREVLRLRFVDGLSLGEIAAGMGIPLGTVKSRLHNALETLRRDERTRSYFER